jgi:hypothetical protein
MDQIAALMMLVGCTSGQAACTEIPVPTPVYQSIEACRSALPLQMRLSSTFDRRVVGECQPIAQADLDRPMSIEWAVSRSGELRIAIEPDSSLVAGR